MTRSLDPAYASQLNQAFQLIRDVWAGEVASTYGKYEQVHGVQVPAWLIAGGSDVTSIAVLALLEYDSAVNGQDTITHDLLLKLCEGLAAYQAGDHGVHRLLCCPGNWQAFRTIMGPDQLSDRD